MSDIRLRIVFAGGFALVSLAGALVLECLTDSGTPEWLVACVSAAVGYIFGHAQVNGFGGAKK